MTSSIDLNSDLGEGALDPGTMPAAPDPAQQPDLTAQQHSAGTGDGTMLEIVSSANIACGFHAGDPVTMRATVAEAVSRGVAIGAHISYQDREGFGRRPMDVPSAVLIPQLVYQIGALQAMAAAADGRVRYVKPHGALYNTIVHDARQARDVATAIREIDDSLVLLGLPGSEALRAADAAGLPTATEAFADRGYTPEGTLVPRSEPGAVLHDPHAVAARIVELVEHGRIRAADGSWLRLSADSVCVHGDTPGAVAMAARVAAGLREAGARIAPFTPERDRNGLARHAAMTAQEEAR
ncbi:LamB/YcsF family protein [Sediminivirga luteola]|uniref:LamB/YcsF family protein n=1 Tax=Sediminivirga luteola TaxID=1774748 RepID=UPI001F5AB658|nr:5-oxoprolinase subunit PxpA [Sediminivirga luteola]MCI2265086.1 LamB/YcsF family protein [Sediminivirga luteola]